MLFIDQTNEEDLFLVQRAIDAL
jgi:hypothetical protein